MVCFADDIRQYRSSNRHNVVSKARIPGMFHLAHNSKMAGHPGRTRMFTTSTGRIFGRLWQLTLSPKSHLVPTAPETDCVSSAGSITCVYPAKQQL